MFHNKFFNCRNLPFDVMSIHSFQLTTTNLSQASMPDYVLYYVNPENLILIIEPDEMINYHSILIIFFYALLICFRL